jgi:peptide/nickel transport system substrate-binding protein
LTISLLLISAIAPVFTIFAQEEVPYGPWVDEIRFESGFEEPILFEKLSAGDMHLYQKDWTDVELLEDIKASPDLDYQTSFGLYYELTFNPVGPEFLDGKFNPFSNKKIREAMNMLVDRDYIVDEIMKGLAVSKTTAYVSAFPDYGRLAETAVFLENKYKHDPEKATAIIETELEGMGAEKVGGKWQYNGEVVTLKMLIRTEDQRLEIGDYVSDLMEDLGFETDRMYRTSAEASPIWLFADPADGLFHIYTAGWISTAISRDDADAKAFFYTDMGLPFPLYQAYDPDPKFYDIADRLNSGNWDTWEERMELMKTGTIMALEDSARVFLVDQLAPFVKRSDISLAFDLSGGFANPIWALTIRKVGEVGGILTAGSAEILVQPWNPEAGTNWLYDSIVQGAVRERFAHIYNPYTGLPMALRMQSVEMDAARGVPTSSSTDCCTVNVVDSVQVPEDAWVDWDVENKEFITADPGTSAKVKLAVNFGDCIGNWKYHDGSVMSMADWLIPMIIDFEQANPDSDIYDPASVAEFESEFSGFKGMRIASESPLVIEYWTDYITREAEFIYTFIMDRVGVNVNEYPQVPWHAAAIGIKAEEEGLLAYSADKAEELDVEWMNYLGGPSEAILEEKLDEAIATKYVPFGGGIMNDYLDTEEITTRYENLKNWYEEKGHFWVGSGAFYLDQVDFVGHSAVIKAFKDYPWKADRFARLAEPPIPVSSVEVPENIIPSLGAVIDYKLQFGGEPYPNDKIELAKYMVLDSAGNIITVGEAEPTAEGEWIIGLDSTETARLSAGSYRLVTVALSTEVAKPGILETPFVVLPDLLTYFEARIASSNAEIQSDIAGLESSLSDTQDTLTELKDTVETTGVSELESRVSSLTTITYLAIIVAIIAIVVAAYGFMSKK